MVTRRATGPTTAEGKAISSQNARPHGLSAKPAADLVAAWFNVILDNEGGAYEEPSADDPRREAALRLAIAEARYQRALYMNDAYQLQTFSSQQVLNNLAFELRDLLWSVEALPDDEPADPDDLENLKVGAILIRYLEVQVPRERRLHKRYLGEARAQRRMALKAWCAFNLDENLNSRNELKLQS